MKYIIALIFLMDVLFGIIGAQSYGYNVENRMSTSIIFHPFLKSLSSLRSSLISLNNNETESIASKETEITGQEELLLNETEKISMQPEKLKITFEDNANEMVPSIKQNKSLATENKFQNDQITIIENNNSSDINLDSIVQTSVDNINSPLQIMIRPIKNVLGKNDSTEKIATLNLETHSRAFAGDEGTALATPILRAILRHGKPANIYFNPDTVAIAGARGKAHAETELIIDFVDN